LRCCAPSLPFSQWQKSLLLLLQGEGRVGKPSPKQPWHVAEKPAGTASACTAPVCFCCSCVLKHAHPLLSLSLLSPPILFQHNKRVFNQQMLDTGNSLLFEVPGADYGVSPPAPFLFLCAPFLLGTPICCAHAPSHTAPLSQRALPFSPPLPAWLAVLQSKQRPIRGQPIVRLRQQAAIRKPGWLFLQSALF
jgi:hypothetical protein